MKTNITFSLLLAGALGLHLQATAQQDPAYSMFMYTNTATNPAMAGTAGTLSGMALYRDQWTGIKGAPVTQFLNLDMPLHSDKVGVGLVLHDDRIGITRNQNFNLQYAYRLKFEKGVLAMGLQGGLNHYKADYTSVVTNPQNIVDNSFSEITNSYWVNVGTGIFYYTEKFNIGVSVPKLLNQSIDGMGKNRLQHQYYLTAGYAFPLSPDWMLRPSTMLKIGEGVPLQADFNNTFWFREKYSIGISYRTNDSMAGIIQLMVADGFVVGYAYDYILSSMSQYATGSNELMIRFYIPSQKGLMNARKF
jgi:type IX secretion system PorP/SprF family membrane protein